MNVYQNLVENIKDASIIQDHINVIATMVMRWMSNQTLAVTLMSVKCNQVKTLTVEIKIQNDQNSKFSIAGICDQRCRNTVGSYRCHCRDGFRLNQDNRTCSDINECEEHDPNLLCTSPAACKNTQGSYRCSCPKGFLISEDGRHCDGESKFLF